MEAVRVQDVAIDDLPWIVEYHPERCTLCGSCVASCTFGAIRAVMGHVQSADGKIVRRMTIRQIANFANACRGCGTESFRSTTRTAMRTLSGKSSAAVR